MSIIIEKCELILTGMRQMQTGVHQTEGKAVVQGNYENGLQTVKPSAGTSGEVFVGFMVGEPSNADSGNFKTPFQESLVVNPTTHTVTLSYEPVAGEIGIFDGPTEITAGAPGAGTYQISGKTVTVNTAKDNKTLIVRYNRTPSYGEVVARQGHGYPGNGASEQLGLTGVLFHGVIYTDQYDLTADWTNPTFVKLGADGIVTTEGNGTTIPNGQVVKLPGAGDPFIAISF